MSAKARTFWRVALRVLVTLGAIVFLVRGVDWHDLTAAARRAGLWVPAALTVLNAGMMGLRALRLRVLLGPQLSFTASLRALLTSSALNNLTPLRAGQVARLWMLTRAAKVPLSTTVAVTMVESILETAALSLLGWLASSLLTGQRWATVASPALLAATLAVLAVLAWRAGRSQPKPQQPTRLGQWLARLQPGFAPLSQPTVALRAAVLSLLAWLCETTMVVLCARSLGLPVGPALAIVVLLGINLALTLPSTPASAGPFESAATAVLVLAGIGKGQAVAFALFYHAIQVIPVTLAGATVLLLTRRPRCAPASGDDGADWARAGRHAIRLGG